MNKCILIFATAWGSSYGGINSFNYDLCHSLSQYLQKQNHLHLKVICVVSEGIEQKSRFLKVHKLSEQNQFKVALEEVSSLIEKAQLEPICLIGHDIHTGQRAIDLSAHLKVSQGFDIPTAIFHHMDYRAYKPFQGNSEPDLLAKQEEILGKADIIFPIGPKLEKSAQDKVRGNEEETHIIRVQPGLASIEPVNMPSSGFSAITFGRVDKKNRLLKQVDLAVASFSKAAGNESKPLGQKPSIVVIGLSEEEMVKESQHLKSLTYKYAEELLPVHAWSYMEERESLFKELRKHSVCMMLSIHEGFGLVGLEAISADVPLILSTNTGLYEAITLPPDKGGLGIVYEYQVGLQGSPDQEPNPKDIKQVTAHLYEIARNPEWAKEKAKQLRDRLAIDWTWENTAKQILYSLGFEVPESVDSSTLQAKNQFSTSDRASFNFQSVTTNTQESIVSKGTGKAKLFREKLVENIELEMGLVPGGEGVIGSDHTERNTENPCHRVAIQPYFMGRCPITQAQWKVVALLPQINCELNPDPSHFKGENRPVERVNWYEANEFCQRLSKYTSHEYFLPSEAQWEYACRSGTLTPFYYGEVLTPNLANYAENSAYIDNPTGEGLSETTNVMSFPPNAFGLYDMHGNVREWCSDYWHPNYQGAPSNGDSWITTGNSLFRVLRGGSWSSKMENCSSSSRYNDVPSNRVNSIGFRVACSIFTG